MLVGGAEGDTHVGPSRNVERLLFGVAKRLLTVGKDLLLFGLAKRLLTVGKKRLLFGVATRFLTVGKKRLLFEVAKRLLTVGLSALGAGRLTLGELTIGAKVVMVRFSDEPVKGLQEKKSIFTDPVCLRL